MGEQTRRERIKDEPWGVRVILLNCRQNDHLSSSVLGDAHLFAQTGSQLLLVLKNCYKQSTRNGWGKLNVRSEEAESEVVARRVDHASTMSKIDNTAMDDEDRTRAVESHEEIDRNRERAKTRREKRDDETHNRDHGLSGSSDPPLDVGVHRVLNLNLHLAHNGSTVRKLFLISRVPAGQWFCDHPSRSIHGTTLTPAYLDILAR